MSSLRELQLLRHAKSDAPSFTQEDKLREISDKGKKAISKIKHWLEEEALIPDFVLVSSALRAQQTFKRLCPDQKIPHQISDELYLASADQIKRLLKQIPEHYQRVMVIGHNPGLHDLASQLTNAQPAHTLLFPTSTLAHIVLPSNWEMLSQGEGKLVHLIKPKTLSSKRH